MHSSAQGAEKHITVLLLGVVGTRQGLRRRPYEGGGSFSTAIERKATKELAEVILAKVRKEFKPQRPETIYVTRSELTRRFCPNTSRQGATTTEDLYLRIIPELIRQGEARLVVKEGKFEVYGFRAEENPSTPQRK